MVTNLGYMYEYGTGVPKDLKAAAELYRKGMAMGDPSAAEALNRITSRR